MDTWKGIEARYLLKNKIDLNTKRLLNSLESSNLYNYRKLKFIHSKVLSSGFNEAPTSSVFTVFGKSSHGSSTSYSSVLYGPKAIL
jgi:hypothetical protein